jgi:hypothetical protein
MATFKRFEDIDQDYVREQEFNAMKDQVEITARKLGKLIEYLRGSEINGVKYKA